MGATHSMIGHNWAHKLKKRQSTSSFRFEGDIIYSYNTAIGQIVTLPNGKQIYLLNSGSYSRSTCKHQNHAFGAIPVDAYKFDINPNGFDDDWTGYWKFDDVAMRKIVSLYLQHIYDNLLAFKTSRAYSDEKNFSLHYWKQTLRFLEITRITTIPKLIAETVENYQLYWGCLSLQDAQYFRKMLKALHNNVYNVKDLVIKVLGQKVWDEYVLRTSGYRQAEETRRINIMVGNASSARQPYYYHPGTKKRRSSSYLTVACICQSDRSISGKQISEWRKSGVLIQKLHEVYHANLKADLDTAESAARYRRRDSAMARLERHLGMRWKYEYFYNRFKRNDQFDYDGTTVVFAHYHRQRELAVEEYKEFVGLSNEDKQQWIHAKRLWMLEQLQEDERRHQAAELEYAARQQELLLARQKHEQEIRELREYVVNKQAEGPQGYRDLFHEGLWQASYHSERSIFYGGNALLRVDSNRGMVITSKGIDIPVEECKRLWTMIHYWHTHNITFVESDEEVRAASNNWSINRYQDDIMIAGCHAIHYNEMKYIAEQLNLI